MSQAGHFRGGVDIAIVELVRMARLELVEKQADADLVREMPVFAAERLMELEVEAGATPLRHEDDRVLRPVGPGHGMVPDAGKVRRFARG